MHLSDLHFGAHDPAVCAAAQRLAQRLGVAMVVVSGDLTQRATAPQFEQAARFVKGLHARSTLVLAGNHDVPLFAWWLRWGRAYERYAHQFGMDQEPVRQMGAFYVVGVNTTRAWRHERGSLSSAQIDHVAALLARAPPDAWRIVASHHPLVARDADDREHRPSRADEAVQRWRTAGAQMLLSGHVHEPGVPCGHGGVAPAAPRQPQQPGGADGGSLWRRRRGLGPLCRAVGLQRSGGRVCVCVAPGGGGGVSGELCGRCKLCNRCRTSRYSFFCSCWRLLDER